jgi:DNA polymerase-1
LGRIRHLPDIHSGDGFLRSQAEIQSINAPVQSFASDLTIMAVIEIMSTFSEGTLNIVGTVHDAILIEIKDERLNDVIPKVKYIMENPAILKEFGIKLPIPIIADVTVGDWGKGEEWKNL